jgi:hypothetical protein
VEAAVAYFSRFLPYLVGKRAAAPDGAKVVFRIGARPPAAVEMAGGRGRLAANPGDATVNLEVPVATFAALIGGRADVPADTVISGDQRLGRRVLESMAFLTPGPVNGSCWPGSADAGIAVRFPPSRRCAIAASGAGEQAGGGPGSAARARAGKPPVTSDRRTSSASLPCAVPNSSTASRV